MKFQVSLYVAIVLILSFIRCGFDSLPFSKGKFIYWLVAVVIGGIYFLVNKSKRKYAFNCFDVLVLMLFTIGFWNLIYISKATIYNIQVWYYAGYLILYAVLRQELNTKDVIYKNLNFVFHFISLTAVLNAIVAILQNIAIIESPNEHFNSTGLFFSPNQLGIYLALGFLSTLEILRKTKVKSVKIVLCTSLVILIYSLYLSECRGAYLALSVAFLFYLFNSKQKIKNTFRSKIAVSSILVLLGSSVIIWNTNSAKTESASGRLFIIKLALEQIKEHPFSGYGIDSFSLHYNVAKARYFATERPWSEVKNASYIYNANNDFLELTFELGIVWIIVFILFAVKLIMNSSKTKETQICCSILLCLVVFACTNSILPVPLFLITGCYCTVVMINISEARPIYAFKNHTFFQVGIAAVLMAALGIMILRLNAEQKLLRLYNGEKHFTSLEKLQSYTSKIDAKGEELFMAGGILLKNKHEEGIDYLAKGFEQSGKPSLGKILAGFYEKQHKYQEAEHIYQYNINVEPFRFDARIDLFRLYSKTNQKQKTREMANRIINLPVKIPSEKVNGYKEEARLYLSKIDKK